jgi:hypothetical protein
LAWNTCADSVSTQFRSLPFRVVIHLDRFLFYSQLLRGFEMSKLIATLVAGLFAASVYAQATPAAPAKPATPAAPAAAAPAAPAAAAPAAKAEAKKEEAKPMAKAEEKKEMKKAKKAAKKAAKKEAAAK